MSILWILDSGFLVNEVIEFTRCFHREISVDYSQMIYGTYGESHNSLILEDSDTIVSRIAFESKDYNRLHIIIEAWKEIGKKANTISKKFGEKG